VSPTNIESRIGDRRALPVLGFDRSKHPPNRAAPARSSGADGSRIITGIIT